MENDSKRSGLSRPPIAPCKENICAVVVTHFPSFGFRDRLARTAAQVAHVAVVDNASEGDAFGRVQEAALLPRVDLLRNAENLGIAGALNRGVEWARRHGYQWALLLDDDTVPADDMVATLVRAFDEFPNRDSIAVIGSNRVLNPVVRQNAGQNGWWVTSSTVITSGSLVDLSVLEVIGSFRDEFFMDFVDFEFCLRARSQGFKVLEVLVPTMQHFIGNSKVVHRLGLRIHEYNHTPWRSYYKARNFTLVLRKYALKEPRWSVRMLWAMAKTTFVAVFIEESRLAKLRYTLLGVYDGLLGHVNRRVL